MATTPRLSSFLKERLLEEFKPKFKELNLNSIETLVHVPDDQCNVVCDSLGISPTSLMTRLSFRIMVGQIKTKLNTNSNNSHQSTPLSPSNLTNNNTNNTNTTNINTIPSINNNNQSECTDTHSMPLSLIHNMNTNTSNPIQSYSSNTINNNNKLKKRTYLTSLESEGHEGETHEGETPESILNVAPREPPMKKRKIIQAKSPPTGSFGGENNTQSQYNNSEVKISGGMNNNNHNYEHKHKHIHTTSEYLKYILNENYEIDQDLDFFLKVKICVERKGRIGKPLQLYDTVECATLESLINKYYNCPSDNDYTRHNMVKSVARCYMGLLGRLQRVMGWEKKRNWVSMRSVLGTALTAERYDIIISLKSILILIICLGKWDMEGKEQIVKEIVVRVNEDDKLSKLENMNLNWKELEALYGSSNLKKYLSKLDDGIKSISNWYGINYDIKFNLHRKYLNYLNKMRIKMSYNNNSNSNNAPFCDVCQVYVSGADWRTHFGGRKHKRNIQNRRIGLNKRNISNGNKCNKSKPKWYRNRNRKY